MKYIWIILALLIPSVTQAELTTRLDSLPAGHWLSVRYNCIRDVMPSPLPPANGGALGVVSYSGGAFDTKHNQLVIWGGGHGDYGGNELYAFKIDSLKWYRIWGPTDVGLIPTLPPGSSSLTYSDGNPCSRHTYFSMAYLPEQNRFLGIGGSRWTSGNASRDIWTMEMDSLAHWSEWDSLVEVSTSTYLPVRTVYDPSTKTLLIHGYNDLTRYDPVDQTSTHLGTYAAGLQDHLMAAYDPVRKIYVLVGDSQVLLYDLKQTPPLSCRDTTAYCTGDTAIIVGSPSIAYDPISDRIVAWKGGGAVYSLNLDTMAWTRHMPSAGNTVTPGTAQPSGTFGRFQYVPSHNVLMVISAEGSMGSGTIDSSVYFYKMPYITRVDLPLQKWVAVPSPVKISAGNFTGPCYNGKCKHIRITYSPDDAKLYWYGGDHNNISSEQEMFSLSMQEDSLVWTKEYGFCPATGESIPNGPDETGWFWDTKRSKLWMMPGYMLQPGSKHVTGDWGTCDSSREIYGKTMAFDITTHKWTTYNYSQWDSLFSANTSGARAQYWSYDPKTDRFISLCEDSYALEYNPNTGGFAKYNFTTDSLGNDITGNWGKAYQAIDSTGGWVYGIDPYDSTSTNGSALYRYNPVTHKMWYLGKTPRQCEQGGGYGYQDQNIIWDSTNKVLVWNRNYEGSDTVATSQLFVYHPDTAAWEEMPKVAAVDWDGAAVTYGGGPVHVQGRQMAYDAHQNIIMITGTGQETPYIPYIFLYRYGNGAGTEAWSAPEEEPPTGSCATHSGF